MASLKSPGTPDVPLGIDAILRTSPVIAVLTLERLEDGHCSCP